MRLSRIVIFPILPRRILLFLVCAAVAFAAVSINSTSLPTGQVGQAYYAQLSATGNSGALVWSIISSQLPTGFVLDPNLGVICSGTLVNNSAVCSTTASTSGTFAFTLQALDSATNATAQRQFSITILGAGPPSITSTSPLPSATVGQAYSYQFQESGGVAPFDWLEFSAASTFPFGFTLDAATGILSSPQVSSQGQYTFAVEVLDANGTLSSPKQFSLTIGTNGGNGTLTAAPAGLSFTAALGGTVATPSAPTVGIFNNSASLSYSLSATTQSGGNWIVFPNGNTGVENSNTVPVSINSSILPTLTAATYYGTITATDTNGNAVSIAVTLVVSGTPTVTVTNGSGQAVTSLFFAVPAGTAPTSAAAQQTVTIAPSTGPVTLTVTPQSAGSFVYVNGVNFSPIQLNQVPVSGTPLTVSVSTLGLLTGTNASSAFTICYANSANCVQIPVTLSVTGAAQGPTVSLTNSLNQPVTSFTFNVPSGTSPSSAAAQQTVTIAPSSGPATLVLTPQSLGSFVYLNGANSFPTQLNQVPVSGSLLTVAVSTNGLFPGTNIASAFTICFVNSVNCMQIPVTVHVTGTQQGQAIAVDNSFNQPVSSLTFNVPAGTPPTSAGAQQALSVLPNTGPATLTLTQQTAGSFLFLNGTNVSPIQMNQVPLSGAPLIVSVSTVGLSAGTSTSSAFTICYANSNVCVPIQVTLNVTSTSQGSTIGVTSGFSPVTSLTFTIPPGASQTSAAAQQVVTVVPATGPASLSVTPQTSGSWLYLNGQNSPQTIPSVPVTGTQLTVAVNTTGLASNTTYSSAFTICYSGTANCVQIPVTVLVQTGVISSSLQITTTSLPDGTVGQPYSATIFASGGQAPYSWSMTGTLPSGLVLLTSTGSSATVTGTPTTPVFVYITVRVTDSAFSSASQTLTLNVGSAAVSQVILSSLSPNTVTAGGSGITLQLSGGPFAFGAAVQWNGITLATSYLSGQQLTAAVPQNLLGSPGTAAVTVVNPGALPSNALTFTINATGPAITTASPLPQGSVGTPYTQGLVATGGAAPYRGWTLSSGSLPPGISLTTLSGFQTGLLTGVPSAGGVYTFTVQLTDNAGSTATKQFSLTITGGAVTINTNGIVNAASFDGNSVAPGEIVTIFGTNLGPSSFATLQLDGRGYLTTSLAGTQVTFDGVPAPLIYSWTSQVSAVVPYEIAGRTSTQVQVTFQGQNSSPVTMPVAFTHPGIFSNDASGRGQGAIVNQNGTLNSPSNPASVGSYVFVYATGEGQTNPPGIDGKPGDSPAPQPIAPVSATIGGINVQPQYAGGVPGLVAGLIQVNLKIPAGVASGPAVPILLQMGGQSSQTGVTVAIK